MREMCKQSVHYVLLPRVLCFGGLMIVTQQIEIEVNIEQFLNIIHCWNVDYPLVKGHKDNS